MNSDMCQKTKDSVFFEKKSRLDYLDHFCPSAPMSSLFLGGGGGATTTTATTTNLRLPGPSLIAPRDRIPREGPPHLDDPTKNGTNTDFSFRPHWIVGPKVV